MSISEFSDEVKLLSPKAPLSRRRVLSGAAIAIGGLGAAALIGCGGEDDEEATATPTGGQSTGTPAASKVDQPTDDYVRLHKEDGAPAELPYNYPEPDKTPKSGGTIRVATSLVIFSKTFDMNEPGQGANGPLVIADRLIGYVNGPKMSKYKVELQPELARSCESSPDGLTYTFNLQSGIKFQNVAPINGRLLRAEDIKLSIERAAKQGFNAPQLTAVDQVTTPDDKTVRISLKRPDPDLLIPLGDKAMPIFPPELYDQNLLASVAIGTGPGILDAVESGQFLRIKANPDYWQGKPLVDGIEWQNVPDVATRVASFRTGLIESGNTLAANIAEARALVASNPEAHITGNPILNGVYQYIFNAANPKFKDARVRQALSLAIDRERLNQLAFQGYGKNLPGLPWIYIFDKTPTAAEMGPWFKYDPTEAKRLLAAAGAEGLSFEIKCNPPSAGPSNIDAQNSAVAEFFKNVGVSMKVTNLEAQAWAAYYNQRNFVTEPGEAMFGYVTGPATATGFYYNAMHSSSPGNTSGVNDPQIDQLAEKQRVELNPTARKQMLRQIWDRMLTEMYHINAGSTYFVTAMQPYVRYWRMNAPLLTIYSTTGFGYGFHKGWLDK